MALGQGRAGQGPQSWKIYRATSISRLSWSCLCIHAHRDAHHHAHLCLSARFFANQALVDEPSIFEDLGFTAGENSLLADSCVKFNFFIDDTAEIMGTQVKKWWSLARATAARVSPNSHFWREGTTLCFVFFPATVGTSAARIGTRFIFQTTSTF